VAISATTIIQREITDEFRGRVFSFYDMLFNVPFVIGAAIGAAFMPDNGKSYPLVAAAGGGYVLAGLLYSLLVGRGAAGGTVPASPATDSPSASAHRSNS
jgi:MFS family permease